MCVLNILLDVTGLSMMTTVALETAVVVQILGFALTIVLVALSSSQRPEFPRSP